MQNRLAAASAAITGIKEQRGAKKCPLCGRTIKEHSTFLRLAHEDMWKAYKEKQREQERIKRKYGNH